MRPRPGADLRWVVAFGTRVRAAPQPLVDQLKDDGRMVIPVGDRFAQELYLLEKKNGQLKQSATLPVRFVPMAREASDHK